MGLLILLSGLLFGDDIRDLGSTTFHVRQTAHERLKSAGWLAYPAAVIGCRSDNPERADRCADLVERLEGPVRLLADVDAVARGARPLPAEATDEYLQAVCRRVDRIGGWWQQSSWSYVYARPYRDGTRRGECEYVVRMAAVRRSMPGLFGQAAVVGK